MNVLIAIALGLLPAVVLVFYIYMLDKNQREPLPWILKAFGYGVLCAIPAIVIEAGLSLVPIPEQTLGKALYDAFVVAALSEESMKLLFLWLLLRKNPYFDERMDCIVYATCVSMGFAGLENVLYVLDNMEEMASVATARALLSVPGHFFAGVFMGYFMSLYFWGKPERRRRNWVLILLAPVILHGIYDASLMSMPLSEEIMVMAVLIFLALGFYVWIGGHRRIVRVLARDKKHMHFTNPLHQEGSYNQEEHAAPAYAQNGMDEEKRAAIAEVIGVLTASKEQRQDEEIITPDSQPANPGIFRNPFSFNGRIGRKEFIYSYVIYTVWYYALQIISSKEGGLTFGESMFVLLTIVPMYWFNFAQCCKRCHDTGHSGWWQLIPFYPICLLFAEGDSGSNEYGEPVA